ncbi:FadR/GntR family transcriptional regulator [Geoalkalibacter halelectricus]|uniref:Pyruvate dehydrogenase complex repressor n=1 Tax=Geoalkalibacter halelectricus TaxID=2847045 RepID=A0ABY5ZMY4_9BACT|nr:FadR/GntR family transcriptional regulator [Geoalkalibacter halelectricus]MDO3378466.1 FadR family transcriptional regulator [Geoalkalibacter halelectricus]UWZ80214.1 FadR family transcriptional regulator [Geoalkalibacter halelectricus]
MASVFRPIRPKKISEEIVEQIKALISAGELKPGEKIPSERELAGMLGVSRPSVREAIMVLDAMGLVEARQGGGTYVRSLTAAALQDPLLTLVEENPAMHYALVEVRMGLETWSAYLAAQRATDEEIKRLRELLGIMERQAAQGGWDADVDAQFHYAITAATHNTLQMHVLNTIHSLFHKTIQVALTEFYRRDGMVELLLEQHRAIFEGIAERNPEKARTAMFRHLTLVEEKMSQLQGEA